LLESLTDAQWLLIGKNFPERLNDEDEGRTVGAIAGHVAASEDFIVDRIFRMLEGGTLPPVDVRQVNTTLAARHAGATREQVIEQLRQNRERIAARVAAIPDDQLHIVTHLGSIRAAVS
jgi:hypothetical protein